MSETNERQAIRELATALAGLAEAEAHDDLAGDAAKTQYEDRALAALRTLRG